MFVTGRMRDENDIYNIKKNGPFSVICYCLFGVEKCPKEIFELMERPGKIMEAIIRVVRSDTK